MIGRFTSNSIHFHFLLLKFSFCLIQLVYICNTTEVIRSLCTYISYVPFTSGRHSVMRRQHQRRKAKRAYNPPTPPPWAIPRRDGFKGGQFATNWYSRQTPVGDTRRSFASRVWKPEKGAQLVNRFFVSGSCTGWESDVRKEKKKRRDVVLYRNSFWGLGIVWGIQGKYV